TSFGSLQYDSEIERTARANRKAVRLAKEAARQAECEQIASEEEVHIEMAEAHPQPPIPPRRTLG
ncbi:hypothetical protein A2U01_0059056, partial [Trifolium medium]|nr:hypothetical protein [Trifolium medium]